jgi:hypothetical protein
VLGVTRRPRAPLAELLDVVERQVVPGEVEHAVEQHRRVAAREHEAVAVRPVGVLGHVAQVPAEDLDGDPGERHRSAGVAAVRLLDGVDRQEAHGPNGCIERVGTA